MGVQPDREREKQCLPKQATSYFLPDLLLSSKTITLPFYIFFSTLSQTRRDAASTRVGDAVSYLLKAITTKQSSQSSQSDSRTKVRATLHKLADRQSCRAQLIQSAIPTSDALSCFFKYFTSRQGFLSHDQGGPNCGRGLVSSRRRRQKRTTERWVSPSDAVGRI